MKTHPVYGLVAGLAATIVLSALMVLKSVVGLMPAMNAIMMLTHLGHGFLGTPATPIVGWIIHVLIGVALWGLLFDFLRDFIPGTGDVTRGLVFATGAWLLMMVIVMPLAGAGLFGLRIGAGAPVATLVLHWVYGAVLGAIYAALAARTVAAGETAGS